MQTLGPANCEQLNSQQAAKEKRRKKDQNKKPKQKVVVRLMFMGMRGVYDNKAKYNLDTNRSLCHCVDCTTAHNFVLVEPTSFFFGSELGLSAKW